MPVAEVFLSAFVAVLFERLVSRDLLNFAFREGIQSQIKNCSKALSKIQAVLGDAEEKQITDIAVKMWLEDLQDLADDLDDMLDDMTTEALRCKLMAEHKPGTSKVPEFISALTNNAMFKYNMRSKIDEMLARLQQISDEKIYLNLKEHVEGIKSNKKVRTLPSTSLKRCVYGREDDKKKILELLLHGEKNDDKVCVISILGMGGIGKTTLAQEVYNDDKVNSWFDLKSWVCVSDDFDVVAVTKAILVSLTSEACNLNDFNTLQVKVKNQLLGKKFLLVLDDMWNENYSEWDAVRQPLLSGAPGSKIIVTTRSEKVASVMRALPACHLKVLGNDDCLSLLAQHAFERRNFDVYPHLKEIGKQLVNKCKGLPLAVKTLGGLLRSKLCQIEWEDVLNSKIWDISEQENDILPTLRLSYHHLPSHLKQCFAYCSIFSKDYEFDKDELVLFWMAVGLLQKSKRGKRIEDVGRKYVDDLLSRSFFQQSSGSESRFFMHDLMNDLAQLVAGEICFRLEEKCEGTEQYKISSRIRHLSYIRESYEIFHKFEDVCELQRLRTFLPLSSHKFHMGSLHLTNKVLTDLLPKFQCLRVLSLSGYTISELPDSIGDLKHLRYLDLSETSIKWLPESVSTLYNLQTLSLQGCGSLCKLPKNTGNLINLRHLDNSNTEELQGMPSWIGKMTSLQTLSKIVVSKSSEFQLKELGNLRLLRGALSIVGLQNVMDTRNVMGANIRCMQDLDKLELKWGNFPCDERLERDVQVLDMLQPCRYLKMLEINHYEGVIFPSWVGDPSFREVVQLSLIDCRRCTCLPPLGQLPKLKELCISGLNEVRSVGSEFFGECCPLQLHFPSLQSLSFEDMPEWKDWSYFIIDGEVGSQFPSLRELTLVGCPKLTNMKRIRLPSLLKLELKECQGVVLKSLTDLISLTTLRIDKVTELTCLDEELKLESLICLKELCVWKCPQLKSLGEEEKGLPCNIEVLRLVGCDNLVKLPNGLNSLVSLIELSIDSCPKLVSFPETFGPPMLRHLHIVSCDTLESLPKEGMSYLKTLEIRGCPSLRSTGKLSPTLKYLFITGCIGLESLPIEGISHLEELTVWNCPSLRSWPADKLPTTIKKLRIGSFTHLELVTPLENNCSMSSLDYIIL